MKKQLIELLTLMKNYGFEEINIKNLIELITMQEEEKENICNTCCCDNVKNTNKETPTQKIQILTKTLETCRNIPYTSDTMVNAIKKINNLIDEV